MCHKVVCDIVVCDRERVTKLCVCEQVVCVTKLCVRESVLKYDVWQRGV